MGSKIEAPAKWNGKTTAELKRPPAQVWPFLADFCNIQKIFPGCETCYELEGVTGQPGLIRYCTGPATENGQSTIKWAKEKLIAIDPIKRCLSYEVLENTWGFNSYVATMQVIPVNDDEGCMIEWSFVSDPIEGYGGLEGFMSFYESALQYMATKIEDALLSSASATAS